jgi:hypothetical protein
METGDLMPRLSLHATGFMWGPNDRCQMVELVWKAAGTCAACQQGVGDQEENTRMLAGPDPEAILGASCHKALLQSLGWSRACGVVQVAIGYFRHAPRR